MVIQVWTALWVLALLSILERIGIFGASSQNQFKSTQLLHVLSSRRVLKGLGYIQTTKRQRGGVRFVCWGWPGSNSRPPSTKFSAIGILLLTVSWNDILTNWRGGSESLRLLLNWARGTESRNGAYLKNRQRSYLYPRAIVLGIRVHRSLRWPLTVAINDSFKQK
jgi:hypothetical protein